MQRSRRALAPEVTLAASAHPIHAQDNATATATRHVSSQPPRGVALVARNLSGAPRFATGGRAATCKTPGGRVKDRGEAPIPRLTSISAIRLLKVRSGRCGPRDWHGALTAVRGACTVRRANPLRSSCCVASAALSGSVSRFLRKKASGVAMLPGCAIGEPA